MTHSQSVIRAVLHGDVPERALKELAYRIEDELASLPLVSYVETSGVRSYESFPDRGVAAWDNSGLDWQDGQVVSVQLVQAATPVPALPVAGAVLLVLVLLVRGWRR